MIRLAILSAALLFALPATAQILPDPGPTNPRMQTVTWQNGQRIILTALPMTGLTVVLQPGERIVAHSLAFPEQWDLRISPERDSFHVTPRVPDAESALTVTTDRRQYIFTLQTGDNLNAALLVQVIDNRTWPMAPNTGPLQLPVTTQPATPSMRTYRLRGDRSVQPQAIGDDGRRTRILFAPGQALPAIFAIVPTGDEEVVNGYMRGDAFEIDRVYERLVFRIDKDKATARRAEEADAAR
jgi:type IV secretion system protein VirB9